MFFPDIFAIITLIHKQIIAMAGYYAWGAFISYSIEVITLVSSPNQILVDYLRICLDSLN